jgi:hypothetical protein
VEIEMITVDGGSTPAGNLAAAERLVSDGVFGVIDYSSFTFGGYEVFQHAGQNPTRTSFINNLRQVTDYTAGGILPSPTSFANFGTPQMMGTPGCTQFVQLSNGQFVNANPGGKPVCGSIVKFPAST